VGGKIDEQCRKRFVEKMILGLEWKKGVAVGVGGNSGDEG